MRSIQLVMYDTLSRLPCVLPCMDHQFVHGPRRISESTARSMGRWLHSSVCIEIVPVPPEKQGPRDTKAENVSRVGTALFLCILYPPFLMRHEFHSLVCPPAGEGSKRNPSARLQGRERCVLGPKTQHRANFWRAECHCSSDCHAVGCDRVLRGH